MKNAESTLITNYRMHKNRLKQIKSQNRTSFMLASSNPEETIALPQHIKKLQRIVGTIEMQSVERESRIKDIEQCVDRTNLAQKRTQLDRNKNIDGRRNKGKSALNDYIRRYTSMESDLSQSENCESKEESKREDVAGSKNNNKLEDIRIYLHLAEDYISKNVPRNSLNVYSTDSSTLERRHNDNTLSSKYSSIVVANKNGKNQYFTPKMRYKTIESKAKVSYDEKVSLDEKSQSKIESKKLKVSELLFHKDEWDLNQRVVLLTKTKVFSKIDAVLVEISFLTHDTLLITASEILLKGREWQKLLKIQSSTSMAGGELAQHLEDNINITADGIEIDGSLLSSHHSKKAGLLFPLAAQRKSGKKYTPQASITYQENGNKQPPTFQRNTNKIFNLENHRYEKVQKSGRLNLKSSKAESAIKKRYNQHQIPSKQKSLTIKHKQKQRPNQNLTPNRNKINRSNNKEEKETQFQFVFDKEDSLMFEQNSDVKGLKRKQRNSTHKSMKSEKDSQAKEINKSSSDIGEEKRVEASHDKEQYKKDSDFIPLAATNKDEAPALPPSMSQKNNKLFVEENYDTHFQEASSNDNNIIEEQEQDEFSASVLSKQKNNQLFCHSKKSLNKRSMISSKKQSRGRREEIYNEYDEQWESNDNSRKVKPQQKGFEGSSDSFDFESQSNKENAEKETKKIENQYLDDFQN